MVEVGVEAREMLGMVVGERLEDRRVQFTQGYRQSAYERLVVLGEILASDAVAVDVDFMECHLTVPQDIWPVEQDAQPQFPVVPSRSVRIPSAGIDKMLSASHISRGGKHGVNDVVGENIVRNKS